MLSVLYLVTSDDFLGYLPRTLRALRARGVEVHVGTRRGARLAHLEREGVAVGHDISFSRALDPRADARALGETLRLVDQLQPDLVHAHNPKAGLVGMTAAALLAHPRRVYTVHGLPYVTARGFRRALYRSAEMLSCGLAHRVLAVSPSVRARLIEDGVSSPERTGMLGGGSAEGAPIASNHGEAQLATRREFRARHGIPEEAPLALFVGRLHREKGLVELAEAFELVQRGLPDVRLVVVGEPDPTGPVEVASLERIRGVVMTGYLPDPNPAYAAADVLVLPSYREGLPTVVLEAAAHGLPTIGTAVLGTVDAIVSGDTGLLVEPHDVEALGEAMAQVLSDVALGRRLGRRAREWALTRFSHEALLSELEHEYLSLDLDLW